MNVAKLSNDIGNAIFFTDLHVKMKRVCLLKVLLFILIIQIIFMIYSYEYC